MCGDCEQAFVDKVMVSGGAAGCFADLRLISGADKKILNEMEKVLVGHFTELMHRRPKMAKYFLR